MRRVSLFLSDDEKTRTIVNVHAEGIWIPVVSFLQQFLQFLECGRVHRIASRGKRVIRTESKLKRVYRQFRAPKARMIVI